MSEKTEMEGLRTPGMARMRGAASSDSGFVSSGDTAAAGGGANPQPGLVGGGGGGGGGLQVRGKKSFCHYKIQKCCDIF